METPLSVVELINEIAADELAITKKREMLDLAWDRLRVIEGNLVESNPQFVDFRVVKIDGGALDENQRSPQSE